MSRKSLLIIILLGIFLSVTGWVNRLQAQERVLIKEGDLFPGVVLKPPVQPGDRAYLGISGDSPFAVKDIKAKVILVEIMNVYCASCQNMAPIYNELYALINSQPAIRKQIKMIGIAVGNEDEEIRIFRDHFQVPFPIIPDTQYILQEALGSSLTPFSIIVRRGPKGKVTVVASTHLGFNEHYEELLSEMKSVMAMDPEAIRKKGLNKKGKVQTVKPLFSEEELEARIKTAFTETGGLLTGFEKIKLSQGRVIYTGKVETDGQDQHLFADVISRLPTCDVCHDIHFIITFDQSGKILQFIPLQLTKYGNENWNEADIEKMRRRIVGRYFYHPFSFKAKADAVTSATITSAAIFRGLNEGQVIFNELKKRGLL